MQFKDIRIHEQLLSMWQKSLENKRLPQTILLSGHTGHGSLFLGLQLANMILCGNDPHCREQTEKFIHPDLHFIFPTVTGKHGSSVSSENYMEHWHGFLRQNPFASYQDWLKHIDAGDKEGLIRVKDAENLSQKIFRYPVLSKNKVVLIWLAEKMNAGTTNKLLKVLEEPPSDTYFIMVTENEKLLLPTVLSRCIVYRVPPVPQNEVKKNIRQLFPEIEAVKAAEWARTSGGDWNKVLQLVKEEDPNESFKNYFVEWVRIAWSAAKRPKAINELTGWTERISNEPKIFQRQFLVFSLEIFREAYLIHKGIWPKAYTDFSRQNFNLQQFAPYIHDNNIEILEKTISESVYQLGRNAHAKLNFLNLSIAITHLLHQKKT